MNEPVAYLNGRWIPQRQAAISVVDAGFVQGTTVAEQLRTFGGRLFRLDDHVARLFGSLRVVGVSAGVSADELGELAEAIVARNHRLLAGGDDLGLSIFVTPGLYAGYTGEPAPAATTLCLHTYPLPFHLWAEKYTAGQALRTTSVAQVPPQCWPATLKCRSRMHYYLADRQAALAEPGSRALMLDSRGHVNEASTANVLLYHAGEGLLAPSPEQVLRGISQAVVVELAEKNGIATTYCDLTVDHVAAADEVIITSTPFALLPVTRFNGRAVGGGRAGPVFRALLAAFGEAVGIDIAAQAARFAQR